MVWRMVREFTDGHTFSRISQRSRASDGVSGEELPDDCSTRDVAETAKGIRRDSIPRFKRSSLVMGGIPVNRVS